jgi:putative exporter of polyketide antibiotics
MNINYWWLSLFIVLIAILVIWLIKRNRKDEKEYEKELIRSELRPGGNKDHDEPSPDNV